MWSKQIGDINMFTDFRSKDHIQIVILTIVYDIFITFLCSDCMSFRYVITQIMFSCENLISCIYDVICGY